MHIDVIIANGKANDKASRILLLTSCFLKFHFLKSCIHVNDYVTKSWICKLVCDFI